ncbi:site-specific integrase [Apilactobacillus timberlakei]|uniref:Site-specific integrase n=1 Tax=Apilactobacillus timberlakei TaxID=2008380 RepID=A0ABY2YSG1_9LACO|nr:tyrosine-type recombinase/integrase [Apilactobacillus timberlakei]TPR12439.1 site-specific integrase [Apilactobacillus timberlakei]TPR12997.1 site-specific integrase [Apilactobacillus timberlakei]
MVSKDLSDEIKDHIHTVTLVNPSFNENPKGSTIIKLLDNTELCVKDILKIKISDILDNEGNVKTSFHFKSSKTGKYEDLDIKNIQKDLKLYVQWLNNRQVNTKWLFPNEEDKHIDERNFYLIMHRVGELLGINYLGTHTMRKTGAYRVYVQSNYNISLVMSLLNHSSQAMTLKYLGLDRESTENMLDKINFG